MAQPDRAGVPCDVGFWLQRLWSCSSPSPLLSQPARAALIHAADTIAGRIVLSMVSTRVNITAIERHAELATSITTGRTVTKHARRQSVNSHRETFCCLTRSCIRVEVPAHGRFDSACHILRG